MSSSFTMASLASLEGSTWIAGPDFHVDLGPLDARHPEHYSRRLLIFRCGSSDQRNAQINALKAGLRRLVRRCPPLAGSVEPQQDAGFRLCGIAPGKGLELVVKDMHSALPSFAELEEGDFQPEDLPFEYLMPEPQDFSTDQPYAACRIMYSAINGGTVITWAMTHSLADGTGHNELMRALAEEIKNSESSSDVGLSAITADLGMDRSALINVTSELKFDASNHPAYAGDATRVRRASTDWQLGFGTKDTETPLLLSMSQKGLQRLKDDATQADAPPISSHDALVALLWRSIMRIRRRRAGSAHGIRWDFDSTLYFPTDARKHLRLSPAYVGNAVYQLAVSLDLGTLLSPSGLQQAASAVRQSISSIDPADVRALMVAYKDRWVEWGFMAASLSTVDVAMGTDWTSGGVYDGDWGQAFGRLERLRYPGEEGLNAIMPKLRYRGKGGAEVIISVLPDEADLLRSEEYFGKYLRV